MNARTALLLLLCGCAAVPRVTCSELADRKKELMGKRVALEGEWIRGWHGSFMCTQERSGVVYLNDIPEDWYAQLSDDKAAVRACGIVEPAVESQKRAASPPIAAIKIDAHCSSVLASIAAPAHP